MPFTDNFNGAVSNTALESWTPSGGGAWSRVDGVANAISVSATYEYAAFNSATNTLYWCDSQGTANHYSSLRIITATFASFLTNRATDANNFIGTRVQASKLELYKRSAGSFTLLGTTGTIAVSAGDILRIESASDNKHTVKLNGAQHLQATDAFNASQVRQGLCAREAGVAFDDYEAGSLSVASVVINSVTATNITASSATITLGLTR